LIADVDIDFLGDGVLGYQVRVWLPRGESALKVAAFGEAAGIFVVLWLLDEEEYSHVMNQIILSKMLYCCDSSI